MNKILKQLTLLLIALPLTALSQKYPGYLGKKTIVGYEAKTMISFIAPNSEALGEVDPKLVIKHGGFIEQVIGKRQSLGLSLDYFTTYWKDQENFRLPDSLNISGYDNISPLKNAKVTSYGIWIVYKRYSKHFAPLGSHFEFRIGMRSAQSEDLTFDIESLNISGGRWLQYGLGLGYHVNRIIGDRVILSLGLNTNLILPQGDNYSVDGFNFWAEQGVKENTFRRVVTHESLYLKFGIGYLL